MKKAFITLFLILACTFVWSQNFSKISGKLLDSTTKTGVENGKIKLLLPNDSSMVNATISDKNGLFEIKAKSGKYLIKIESIGYKTLFKNIETDPKDSETKLEDILLNINNITLNDLVVLGKKAELTVKGDTLEYNADAYKTTEGDVVENLLEKIPGMEITDDGKVVVNGKNIKGIMVDGEDFFGKDTKMATKNLPAKMVEKIQVLDQRSDMSLMTGFDDGDEETVINLVIRPGMKQGLFGNAFAGYGSKNRYEANAMINYMKNSNQLTFIGGTNNTNNAGFSDISSETFSSMGKRKAQNGNNSGITTSANFGLNFSQKLSPNLKLGGNIRFGNNDNSLNMRQFTQNIFKTGNTFETINGKNHNIGQNFNIDLNMEWQVDELTKIIFETNGSIQRNKREDGENFYTKNSQNDTVNIGKSDYFSKGEGGNLGGEMSISRQIGEKKGRILSASIGGTINKKNNNGENISDIDYILNNSQTAINQRFSNKNSSNRLKVFVSYVEPIGNNNFLQIAYKFRKNNSNSDKDSRSKDGNGNYTILDSLYSKKLDNQFINNNFEFNFKRAKENFNYMIGISVHPAVSKSKTSIGDKILNNLNQNVLNFSPVAQLYYEWSKKHNLRIKYSGNTNQPSVTQLSPVVDMSNPLNISYGNPNLKPSFEHLLRIHYFNFDIESKRTFMFFGRAGFINNDIVSSVTTDQFSGKKAYSYINTNGNWNANARFIALLPIGKSNFSFSTMSFGRVYSNRALQNRDWNINDGVNLTEEVSIKFKSEKIYGELRGKISYNNVKNSLQKDINQEYLNYNLKLKNTFDLPFNFQINSELKYNTNSGYTDGYKQNEWIWDIALEKMFLKEKNGSVRLKFYDILQQKSNINRKITSSYISDTTTDTLTAYFMVHFIYRFNIFKGGAKKEDMRYSPWNKHKRK